MKKIFLLTVAILIVTMLFSCNDTKKPSVDAPDVDTPRADTPIADTPNVSTPDVETPIVDTSKELPEKPETVDEIIALANSYNVDTSKEAFTLDGILESVQLAPSNDAGVKYQNSTAYLGDSVTLGLKSFKNHPNELVIAVGSINPMDAAIKSIYELDDGSKITFPDALARLDVDRAILTFGANAISVQSEETFLTSYKKLIEKIRQTSPDCDIIIQSISPIAEIALNKYTVFTNELINRSNLLLLILAYSEDIKFLNSAPALKGDDGFLKQEFCSNDDGVHINESAYRIWIDFMRTHPLISE